MGTLLLLFLGLAILILSFYDNVILLDAQKKVLNQKFDAWWKSVEHYDKVKFALMFAKKVNSLLDSSFGSKHLSKRLLAKCASISSGLLLVTLSALSLIGRPTLGIAPWREYKDSITYLLHTTESLASPSNYATFQIINMIPAAEQVNTSTNSRLVNINGSLVLVTVTTNKAFDYKQVQQIGNGQMFIGYNRMWRMDDTNSETTNTLNIPTSNNDPLKTLLEGFINMNKVTSKYNSNTYALAYSFVFYAVLFTVNIFLFIISLAFCRTILREVEKSGRTITTFSLAFTNLAFVFVFSCALLLFLTFLAVPLFWLLVPSMYHISAESFSTVLMFLTTSSIALFIAVGGSTKLVLFISMLPSVFALFVGLFSLLAIKWRNGFHFLIKHLFIRLSQKSPIGVLIGIIVFVSGVIGFAVKCIHFLGFM